MVRITMVVEDEGQEGKWVILRCTIRTERLAILRGSFKVRGTYQEVVDCGISGHRWRSAISDQEFRKSLNWNHLL